MVVKGCELREAGPHGQDDICGADGLGGLRGAGAAQGADVEGMVVGYGIIAGVGRDHGDGQELRQAHHLLAGLAPADAAAGDDSGRPRLL